MQRSFSPRAALTVIALVATAVTSLGMIIATSDRLVAVSEHPGAIVLAIDR